MSSDDSENILVNDAIIDRCVGLLSDDYTRQGNFLSLDDVTRVVLRLRLQPEALGILLDRLRRDGINVIEPGSDGPSEGQKPSISDESRDRKRRASGSNLGRHELLNHADEIRLGRRYEAAKSLEIADAIDLDITERDAIIAAGNAARAELILANVRLVIHFAKRHAELSAIPLDDLIQEGILGLFRAVDKWEPDRGFRFSTYASWWIMQSITRALVDRARVVRIPAHILDRVIELRKKYRQLTASLGHHPSDEQIARELGWSLADVYFISRIQRDAKSIDDDGDDPNTKVLRDRLRTIRNESPSRNAESNELKLLIEQVLNTLDRRLKKILVMRFGLLGGKPRTLEYIGRKLGITRERVRQLEKKALEKIATTYRGKALKPYLPEDNDVR